MVGWQESRLMDRHRFPKGIAGIGHGPEEGQKLSQGSRHFKKQADTTPRTQRAGKVPKYRGDDQNASRVEKRVIPICSQCPELLPLEWGGGYQSKRTMQHKLASLCPGGPWWGPVRAAEIQNA